MDTRKEAKHPANSKTAPKGQSHWAHTMTLLLLGAWLGGAFVAGPHYSGESNPITFFGGLLSAWARTIIANPLWFFIALGLLAIVVAILGPVSKKIEDKIAGKLSQAWSKIRRDQNKPSEESQRQVPPAPATDEASDGVATVTALFDEEEATAATPEPEAPKTASAEPATIPLNTDEGMDEKRLATARKLMSASGASDEQSFMWGAHQAFNGLSDTATTMFAPNENDRERGFAIGSMILSGEAGA